MIKVMGLNGGVLYLNYFEMMCIELIPETKITMNNGHYYLVKDSVESIQEQIVALFHRSIHPENRDLLSQDS